MKIATVIGTRPEIIQSSIVSKEIKKNNYEILIHTGQHYDFEMHKIFFKHLKIAEPDFNLEVGSGGQGEQTGKMLIELEKVLQMEKPDLVLVYGDTNSTLAGALVAAKLHIPVVHIESGLRSFDKSMPEEINRILIDHISNIRFAPTKTAVNNLKKEGLDNMVFLVGDVMYDSLLDNLKIVEKIQKLEYLNIEPKEYFLITVHRESNTNDINNLSNIIKAISSIEEKVIFPVHPRTMKYINRFNLKEKIENNVSIIKPVGYIDFLWLEKNAKKILTDSGGIQKEAYFFKVPCITLRMNTEWIETVIEGWNILAGTDKNKIIKYIAEFSPVGQQSKPFGDGNASKKIIDTLSKLLPLYHC